MPFLWSISVKIRRGMQQIIRKNGRKTPLRNPISQECIESRVPYRVPIIDDFLGNIHINFCWLRYLLSHNDDLLAKLSFDPSSNELTGQFSSNEEQKLPFLPPSMFNSFLFSFDGGCLPHTWKWLSWWVCDGHFGWRYLPPLAPIILLLCVPSCAGRKARRRSSVAGSAGPLIAPVSQACLIKACGALDYRHNVLLTTLPHPPLLPPTLPASRTRRRIARSEVKQGEFEPPNDNWLLLQGQDVLLKMSPI